METDKKVELDEKEKFAEEVFKRNHKCNFLRALKKSRVSDELRDYILENIFDIIQEPGGGLGIHSIIECNSCYEKFDITNYEHW